jgi:hypothetical protein
VLIVRRRSRADIGRVNYGHLRSPRTLFEMSIFGQTAQSAVGSVTLFSVSKKEVIKLPLSLK